MMSQRRLLRTFGDLDKEHKGGKEPDFSPLTLQENKKNSALFIYYLSYLEYM